MKIAFWDTWKLMPKMTPIFAKQNNVIVPAEITEKDYNLFEKLCIILYSNEKQFWKRAMFWQLQLVFSTREL